MPLNIQLLIPILLIQLILIVLALVDLRKVEQTKGPKWIWAIVILFIATIGPIIYFLFGRKDY